MRSTQSHNVLHCTLVRMRTQTRFHFRACRDTWLRFRKAFCARTRNSNMAGHELDPWRHTQDLSFFRWWRAKRKIYFYSFTSIQTTRTTLSLTSFTQPSNPRSSSKAGAMRTSESTPPTNMRAPRFNPIVPSGEEPAKAKIFFRYDDSKRKTDLCSKLVLVQCVKNIYGPF